MKQKMNLKDIFAALVLIIYFTELVFPKVTTLFSSSIVCLICFCLWLLFISTVDSKFLLRKKNFVLLVIYLYLAIYPIIFGNRTISNRYIAMSLVLCGCIIFRYYYIYDKLYIMKGILITTIFFSFITMLITYSQLLIDPYISRSIKSSGEYSAALAQRGIGGYTFIYFITALSITVLYYSMCVKQRWKRIISIIWYVFSIVFIIKSNYMTALLTVIVCSAILIVLSSVLNKKWGFALGILFGFVLIVCNLDSIITLMEDFLPSRISRVLISERGDSVMDSITQEFLIDRWPVILSSIDSFVSYPLFGLVGNQSLGYDGKFLTGFGQHSFVFDTFALFGVFGGIIGIYAAFSPIKKSLVWKEHSAFRIAMTVCIGMLYFLNNATDSIALVASVIAPYCASCIEGSQKRGGDQL